VFRTLGHDHFGYSDPRGLPELRKAICDYLRAARAVHCDPEQIVVTAGGTGQGLFKPATVSAEIRPR
jgi:GntR family transcriptional regulator/MocR family aminotransferase